MKCFTPADLKSETAFTRKFCKIISQCNVKYTVFSGSMKQTNGIPDREFSHKLIPGGYCFCEFKKDKGLLNKDQREWIFPRLDAGMHIIVIRLNTTLSYISFEHPFTQEIFETIQLGVPNANIKDSALLRLTISKSVRKLLFL